MTKTYSEYIYHESLIQQAECDVLSASCVKLAAEIENRYQNWMATWPIDYMKFAEGSNSTKLYETYNVFLCPMPGFYDLYKQVVDRFKEKKQDYYNYAIAGWVNVYKKNTFLDWHKHGDDPIIHDGRWHGYVSINAEPSKTLYAEDNGSLVKEIDNKNGYITLSPAGLMHRVSPWSISTKPRITIAFDFILREQIDQYLLNRWIPII